jgi:hypothetical protein
MRTHRTDFSPSLGARSDSRLSAVAVSLSSDTKILWCPHFAGECLERNNRDIGPEGQPAGCVPSQEETQGVSAGFLQAEIQVTPVPLNGRRVSIQSECRRTVLSCRP